jgi:UDP-N-acetylglucosamine 2-epimerase (non-hydrolysing)
MPPATRPREAGLRTTNRYSPFPEEMKRRLITQIAELHLAPTAGSEENLITAGVHLEVTLRKIVLVAPEVTERPEGIVEGYLRVVVKDPARLPAPWRRDFVTPRKCGKPEIPGKRSIPSTCHS